MKTLLASISVTLLSIFATASHTRADTIDDFTNFVNQKWGEKDYAAINQAISSRLTSNSNDVLALSIKAYLNLFGTQDIDAARGAAQSALNIVNASGSDKAKEIAQAIKDQVFSIPETASGTPLTQTQRDKLHATFPKFPMIQMCVALARSFSGN